MLDAASANTEQPHQPHVGIVKIETAHRVSLAVERAKEGIGGTCTNRRPTCKAAHVISQRTVGFEHARVHRNVGCENGASVPVLRRAGGERAVDERRELVQFGRVAYLIRVS